MTRVALARARTGARWYLRIALAAVLLFDLALLTGMLLGGERGPRALASAPALLQAILGRPELVLPLAIAGGVALVRFAMAPGRVGAALVAVACIGVLCEARAASVGGPERFLFAGGTVLVGWLAGLAFARAGGGDRDAEERAAELGAIAALATIYVNAASQKLLASGIGWADGDDLRMLVLSQRPLDGSPTDAVADLVVGSRTLAFTLAAFVETAQLAAISYPFDRRARAVVGAMLIAFHVGVRLLTPISFPQSIALLVIFSFPWGRLLERRGLALADAPDRLLARRPLRGALAIATGAAALAALSFVPPVRSTIESVSHPGEVARPTSAPREAEGPAPFDAARAAALGIDAPGDRIGPCEVASVEASDVDATLVWLVCDGAELGIEVAPTGSRPFHPPRRTRAHDLFYRDREGAHAPAPDSVRDAALDELAARLEQR